MARALSKRFFFECSLCPGALGDTASLLASGGTLAVLGNAQLLYGTHPMHPFAPTIKVSQNIRYATFTLPCTNTIPEPAFSKGKKKIGIFGAETTRSASGTMVHGRLGCRPFSKTGQKPLALFLCIYSFPPCLYLLGPGRIEKHLQQGGRGSGGE